MFIRKSIIAATVGLAGLVAAGHGALAAESGLTLSLASSQAVEGGCRVDLVVANGLAHPINFAKFNLSVERDGALWPQVRPVLITSVPAQRVVTRQAVIPGGGCGQVTKAAVEGVGVCMVEGHSLDAAECGRVFGVNAGQAVSRR